MLFAANAAAQAPPPQGAGSARRSGEGVATLTVFMAMSSCLMPEARLTQAPDGLR